MSIQCIHNADAATCEICNKVEKEEKRKSTPDPHTIVEKRFTYKIPLTRAKARLNTKEVKAAKAFAQQEYQLWWDRYIKKWGVIGPDGHPLASVPQVDKDDQSRQTAVIGIKALWIITHRRDRYERIMRNLRPKNVLYRVLVLLRILKPDVKEGE